MFVYLCVISVHGFACVCGRMCVRDVYMCVYLCGCMCVCIYVHVCMCVGVCICV